MHPATVSGLLPPQPASSASATLSGLLPPQPASSASASGMSLQLLPPSLRRLLPYPELNAMQARVFDSIISSDDSIVVAAPTSSGKTLLFELAILRLLWLRGGGAPGPPPPSAAHGHGKAVYLAPLKALAEERARDWRAKFVPAGLRVELVTGDGGEEGEGGGRGGGEEGGAWEEGAPAHTPPPPPPPPLGPAHWRCRHHHHHAREVGCSDAGLAGPQGAVRAGVPAVH